MFSLRGLLRSGVFTLDEDTARIGFPELFDDEEVPTTPLGLGARGKSVTPMDTATTDEKAKASTEEHGADEELAEVGTAGFTPGPSGSLSGLRKKATAKKAPAKTLKRAVFETDSSSDTFGTCTFQLRCTFIRSSKRL